MKKRSKEKSFLRFDRCSAQTHSCEQDLQETRRRRKEGKRSDMGNYRTRVHLTDNATGWDQWRWGGHAGLCGPTQSPLFLCLWLDSFVFNRKKVARCHFSWRFGAAWVALHHKHHMLQYASSSRVPELIISCLQSLLLYFHLLSSDPAASVHIQHSTKATIKTLTKAWVNTPASRKAHVCLCVCRSLWWTQ